MTADTEATRFRFAHMYPISKHSRATIKVLFAAALWGLSGSASQVLFNRYRVSPVWLLWFRTITSGVILLLPALRPSARQRLIALLHNRSDMVKLLIFALLGMVTVQLTYFLAISNGNAVTATVLQYLGPIILTAYVAIRSLRFPTRRELTTVVMAAIGTVLLLTDGRFGTMVVPERAVLWGLLSAAAGAFYTYYPTGLIKRHGPQTIVGLGLLIGGLLLTPFGIAKTIPTFTPSSVGLIAFIVLLGSALSFYLFLGSLSHLSPIEASLLGSAEPVSAAVVGIGFLSAPLGPIGLSGGLLTLAAVVIVTKSIRSSTRQSPVHPPDT